MYNNSFTRHNPGLLIFLVDQSGSMENTLLDKNYNLAQMVSDAINSILNMLLYKNCYGEEIRRTSFVCIIGYGSDWDNAEILLAEWIDNINKPLVQVRDLLNTDLKKKWNNDAYWMEIYRKADNGGMTPMASAFSLAKDVTAAWIEEHNGLQDPAPCIINITDGYPSDDEFELISAANDIMKIGVPDGNSIIFNIHVSTDSNISKYEFPIDATLCSDELYRMLYELSSTITSDLADGIFLFSERQLEDKEKLFVYNIDNIWDLYRYLHFAIEYAFHHNMFIEP